MKLINFKKISFIDFEFESNDKDSTFKVDDWVRIPKNMIFFERDYNLNWSRAACVIEKVKKYFAMDVCNRRPWRRNNH